jgi:hypothetical protein
MQGAFKLLLPKETRSPIERTAAMTAAIFLISLNLLLVGSLAIRRPE